MSDKGQMATATATIQNRFGIHAGPSALLVKMANRFSSEITFADKYGSICGKSIMQVLRLELNHGAIITIAATGSDAQEAVSALIDVINTIPKDT